MTLPYSLAGLVGAGVSNVMFVFAGQSNMDNGTGTPPRFTTPNSKVKIYDSTAPAGWEDYQPLANASYAAPSTNWGPEVEFLYQYAAANPNTNVWAIKVAQGGTNLAVQWMPPSGTWWTNLVADYNAAQAALSALGVNITPAAFIWMQGEADIGNSGYADNYGTNLTTFFAAIKTLMGSGIKIVCGRVADELLTETGYVYGTPIVRAAQVSVTRATSNAVIISTDPIPMTVPPHYDTADIDTLGLYFYQGFLGTYDDHPVNLAVTWLTGFAGGSIPSNTSPGTAIATVSADPGAFVDSPTDSSGMTYAIASDPDAKVTLTTATIYLENAVIEGNTHLFTWRAYNSIQGYTDQQVTITGAAPVATPVEWTLTGAYQPSLMVLSESNRRVKRTGDGFATLRTNVGKSTGKWYFEFLINAESANSTNYGVLDATTTPLVADMASTNDAAGGSRIIGAGFRTGDFTLASSVPAWDFTAGSVLGFAFDADAKKLWIAKNNVWTASGNPGAGTNPNFTWTAAKTIFPALTGYYSTLDVTLKANTYSPPSGFTALI